MSCIYSIDPSIHHQNNIIGKRIRHHPDPTTVHPNWSSSKRPRTVTTPCSAISAVTQDGDLHHSHPVIDNYDINSPQYSVALSTPAPPFHSHPVPAERSPYYSPSPISHQPQVSLRSEDEIVADVDNSFATGHTGALNWTNDMLVQVLANDIDDLCATNEENGAPIVSDEYHNFFSQYKQPFELDFYIRRLVQYSNCSTAAFVIMLVYLDRVQERCKDLLVTEMNCHRLLCTALVLAIKYLDDEVFSNGYYARVGGVTCDEMNALELKMLSVLGWNLSVTPQTYALYEDGLVQSARLLLGRQLPGSPASEA